MDMKKVVALAAVALLLAAALFAIFAFGGSEQTEPVVTTEETVDATTKVTVPGLEDSFFGDETEEITEGTEPTEETKEKNPDGTEPAETTPPTEPKPTDHQPDDPQPTKPAPTEPEPTEPKPTEPETTKPTEDEPVGEDMDYETFQNMSPAEQQAYIESFDNIEDFFAWYNAAKEAYERANPSIEGGGTIDIGAIIEGKE